MLKKLIRAIKNCCLFIKNFCVSKDKRFFWNAHKEEANSALIVILCFAFGSFLFVSAMKPVVRNGCKLILSDDTDNMFNLSSRVVGVEAQKVTSGTTLKEVNVIGSLKANKEAIIRSEINGKIKEVLFKEGSMVKKGDALIKFEDDGQKAEVEKYTAEYEYKKSECEKNKSLYQQKAGTQKAYHETEAGMKMAKANLASAQFQLSRTIINAPFDGQIGILKGSTYPGNLVQPNTELVYLVDNSKIQVEFLIPAKYIDDLAVGQAVEVKLEAFPNKVFQGAVSAIDSEIDTKNHSVLVKAIIPNEDGPLRHGMLANVKLITGEKNNAILIDDNALDREGQHEFVWIIIKDKNIAVRRQVITGAKSENGIEIISGLQEGDIVVTSGQLKLTDGTSVKILNQDNKLFSSGLKK